MLQATEARLRPILHLTKLFIFWKFVIILVAATAPGKGYDTSTELVLPPDPSVHADVSISKWLFLTPLKKFIRWDAFYFLSIVEREYVYEQEWAFGWGFPALVKLLAVWMPLGSGKYVQEALAAVILSNVSHFLSVIAMYFLCRKITSSHHQRRLPLTAAALHVFSPAGIFLSAPYGESVFSLLNMSGYLCYVNSIDVADGQRGLSTSTRAISLIASGLILGLGNLVRSNGIFNGLLFLLDLFELLWQNLLQRRLFNGLGHLVCVIVAGCLVGAGFLLPQYIAYNKMCLEGQGQHMARKWCTKAIPSIYSFVQQHYWDVGFLRYWTVSNIPLFVLALPMLTIMTLSAVWAFGWNCSIDAPQQGNAKSARPSKVHCDRAVLVRLAIPQMLLALLAVTNFHVQVITRIGSAYPLSYIWLAAEFCDGPTRFVIFDRRIDLTKWVSRWMIVYALVQAGLFASFLPPA